MIKGVHTMFYTSDPAATRSFLRDKLGFEHTDVGDGWLIFRMPEADMGCHPSAQDLADGEPAGTHNISFYCDDLETTVAELEAKGVGFDEGITDAGFGLVTFFEMPGGVRVQLYQPRYARGWDT